MKTPHPTPNASVQFQLHVSYTVLPISPKLILCFRASTRAPLLLSPREARRASRIWWAEIAVCESMPLPVQTSSEGLKKEGEKSKYNDCSRARVPPLLSLDGPLQCVLGKRCWQKQAGLDYKDCSMAWSQRERRLGQFMGYRNVAHENVLFTRFFKFCKFNLSSVLHEVLGAFTQHCFQLKPENLYVFRPLIYTTTVFWRFEDGHFWFFFKWYHFIYM